MEWVTENNQLVKEFVFQNFDWAIDFVNKIALQAEKENHHPDILVHSYKKVKIMLFTHSEGKITEKDYSLAEKIDWIYNPVI